MKERMQAIQLEYGFTDFQMGQLRYTLECIFYEVSKFLLMGAYFAFIHKFTIYVFAIGVLLLLRTCTGGLHFKHYTTCFLFTFFFMFCGINLLPLIPISKSYMLILLLFCLIANNYCAPVVSSYRPTPNGVKIRKSKIQACTIITIYTLLIYVCPSNLFCTVGFWITMLQSTQLIVAKIIKECTKGGISNEKQTGTHS